MKKLREMGLGINEFPLATGRNRTTGLWFSCSACCRGISNEAPHSEAAVRECNFIHASGV
jgi:hypothetical protein